MSILSAQQLDDLARERPDLARVIERGMGAAMSLVLDLEKRLYDV